MSAWEEEKATAPKDESLSASRLDRRGSWHAVSDSALRACASNHSTCGQRSQVVGIQFIQGIKEAVGAWEETIVNTDQGGQNQSRAAECLKHGKALLERDLALALRRSQDTQEHDADEADLAEDALQRGRVEYTAFRLREVLTIEE